MNNPKAIIVSGILLYGVTLAGAVMPVPQDDAHWKNVRQISVQGRGKMSATPDQARFWIEVREEGPKLDDLTARVRSKMEVVMKAVRNLGIADKDIQTQSYQVAPQTIWEGGKPRHIGYFVSNHVQITLHDLKKAGNLISDVQDAGANTINGPQYDFENPQSLERKALQLAMDDAKAKAGLLAQAAGATLGQALQIQEGGTSFPTLPRPFVARGIASAMAQASPPEPIEEGEQTIEATVSVVYALY